MTKTNEDKARQIAKVAERYSVAVTPYLQGLIDASDADDPMARQYLPSEDELMVDAREMPDPIGDEAHSPVKGIVHRYPDRVLLKPLHVCAAYCRFCFRKEMVGSGGESLKPEELHAAIDYIRKTPAIWEVVITGGDPLLLSPRRLKEMISAIDAVPHVQVIRIHTRIPFSDPVRITEELVAALKTAKATLWVAVHVNHAREVTDEARLALARFVDAGIPLVSQTVLLRGINDTAESLEALLRALVKARVKPYYLHHCDLAPGTGHFRTTVAEGQKLMRKLRGRLSGLAQPTYVLDIPGGYGKVPIGPEWLKDGEVTDPNGKKHRY